MDLLFARLQMAVSLGFHIVFAVFGIGMPVLMLIAQARWLRRRDEVARELARHQAKGTAIFFAVGAVSGTVLSFELGLLWPRFMAFAGGVIGFPFALEGFAFFTEAIFLGIWLYGQDRVRPRWHFAAGCAVAASGALSAAFVIMVNGWMNTPTGFRLGPGGEMVDADPVAAMFNPAWLPETVHMLIAAYVATAFGAAAIHAWQLRRDPQHALHRRGLAIAMTVAVPMALLQPLAGDWAAKTVAATQPAKFAAMEGHFATERRAPLRLFGWPDEERQETPYAIEIPGMLSFLAHGDLDAEVRGLAEFPRDEWPPVAIVHVSFQIMLACGGYLLLVAVWFGVAAWRRRAVPTSRPLLWAIVVAAPLAFVAIETGWIVTEVGRQPWIVQRVLRTADTVTPMPGLWVPFAAFTLVYVALAVIVVALLRHQVRATRAQAAARRNADGAA